MPFMSMLPDSELWTAVGPWVSLAVASFLTGFAKAGVTGLGPLVTVIFASATPGGPKRALALIQPVLVFSDAAVYWRYSGELRRSSSKQPPRVELRLLVWTLLGVAFGQLSLGRFDDRTVRRILAAVLTVLLSSKVPQLLGSKLPPVGDSTPPWLVGIAAGWVSMTTNNAGVLVDWYLLSSSSATTDRREFLLRRSSLLLIIASAKVVLHIVSGLLPLDITLLQSALLSCCALVGVPIGQATARHIPQRLFGMVSWSLVVLGTVQLALA